MDTNEPLSPFKKILIGLVLFLVIALSFVLRLDNYKNSHHQDRSYSVDEVVYYFLGKQLKNDFPSYNTIQWGRAFQKQGNELPDYFFKPLFKYPPGFAGLIAATFSLLKENMESAVYVSIASGTLTILLVFLLGEMLFGWAIGLCSALFFAMDPVSIICSQKIWPDSALAFFMTLTIYLFLLAQKISRSSLYILSGLAGGMAVYIKYPGALTIPIIIGIVLNNQKKDIFKKPVLLSLTTPFLMLIPWGIWNFIVYHHSFEFLSPQIHSSPGHLEHIFLIFGIMIVAALALNSFLKRKTIQNNHKPKLNLIRPALYLMFTAFTWAMAPHIFKSISLDELPFTTWFQGMLSQKPTFYFGRMIEFSFLYFFAFMGIILSPNENKNKTTLVLASIFILLFYILWGNNQCRYIASVIPFLAILCIVELKKIFGALFRIRNSYVKFALLILFAFLIAHSLYKTYLINKLVSFPNDMCYF